VANALGVAGVSDDPVAAIERALGDAPGLLVLDNCEHLVARSASWPWRCWPALPGCAS